MMKRNVRLAAAAFLVLAIVSGLWGCGKKEEPESAPPPAGATTNSLGSGQTQPMQARPAPP